MGDFVGTDPAGPELTGLSSDYLESSGPDLLARWSAHQAFWDARLTAGVDPYCRSTMTRIGPECVVLNRAGERLEGVNFASQDYLSLASHPAVCEAGRAAIGRWGVHSAGSVVLQGGSAPLLVLEERLGELLSCREVAVFSTGWAAGYGAIRALVREADHIVIDVAAHACHQEGAANATRNLHRVPNCNAEAVRQRLAARPAANGGTAPVVKPAAAAQ